jgi:acetyl esterase/lipase
MIMHAPDVLSRAARPPDLRLTYGPLSDHVADAWLPAPVAGARAPSAPLVLFLHGGFWRAAYDRAHAAPLAEALAAAGFAVCTPVYRRTGQHGGGWPGTFDDVAAAIEVLPSEIARASDGLADPGRLVLAGHSAGGHLALWAAGRGVGGRPAPAVPAVRAVVSLAAVCDLAGCYRLGLGGGAAGELMGGSPEDFPDRYAAADPMAALPTGASIRLVHGTADDNVPWQQSRDYAEAAERAADDVTCSLLPDCGHFELIDPLSVAWPVVLAEFRSAAGGLGRIS